MQVQDVSQLIETLASEGLGGKYSKLTGMIAEVALLGALPLSKPEIGHVQPQNFCLASAVCRLSGVCRVSNCSIRVLLLRLISVCTNHGLRVSGGMSSREGPMG